MEAQKGKTSWAQQSVGPVLMHEWNEQGQQEFPTGTGSDVDLPLLFTGIIYQWADSYSGKECFWIKKENDNTTVMLCFLTSRWSILTFKKKHPRNGRLWHIINTQPDGVFKHWAVDGGGARSRSLQTSCILWGRTDITSWALSNGKQTPSFMGPMSRQFKGRVSKSQLEWVEILLNQGCFLGIAAAERREKKEERKKKSSTEVFSLAVNHKAKNKKKQLHFTNTCIKKISILHSEKVLYLSLFTLENIFLELKKTE